MSGFAPTDELNKKLEAHGYDDPLQVAIASPADLMNSMDISGEKAASIIESARNEAEMGGFKTGSEVTNPPDLSDIDAVSDVESWTKQVHSIDRISWLTPSNYSVVVTSQPSKGGDAERTFRVHGILPPEGEHNPQQSKKEERTLKERIESAEEAVGFAVGYMESRPVEFEEDLTEFTGISERTAEYLLFAHDVKAHQDLYELWKDGELEDKVSKNYKEDLDEEIEDMFGSTEK